MTDSRRVSTSRTAWLPAAGLPLLALALLGLALTYPLSHDEQQYVAGGALAFELQIYRDFMYIQTPYWALVLGAAMEVVGERPFLVARLVNWLLSSATVWAVYALARQGGASRALALGAAALVTSSSVMSFSFGTARNDILPCLLALLGCYAYLRASAATRQITAASLFVLAGTALAAAVGTKVSFVFAPLAIVLFSLARQAGERAAAYWRVEFLPLAAGGLVGALPMIGLALASPANFWYGVVQYHGTATLDWYAPVSTNELSLPYQLQLFTRLFLRSDATLAASIWLVAAIGAIVTMPGRRRLGAERGRYLLPLVVLVVGIPFAFIPRPSWVQYFAPLVPFLVLTPVFVLQLLPEVDARRYAPVAFAAIVLGSVSGLGNLAVDGLRALRSGHFTTTEVRDLAAEIDAALGDRGGAVITLAPIYALEGARPIAPELVMGPQFFRTGDSLDAAAIRRLRGVSPATLADLLEREPPAAILIGVETVDRFRDVEAPLAEYAATHGFEPVPLRGPPAATLFLAPRAP